MCRTYFSVRNFNLDKKTDKAFRKFKCLTGRKYQKLSRRRGRLLAYILLISREFFGNRNIYSQSLQLIFPFTRSILPIRRCARKCKFYCDTKSSVREFCRRCVPSVLRQNFNWINMMSRAARGFFLSPSFQLPFLSLLLLC